MIVSIDFETRSAVDLRKTGVYKYAEDATTEVWCMAYVFGDEEEVHVWQPGDPIDTRLEDYIVEGGKLRAWNANFERVIWQHIMVGRHQWPRTKLGQWHCTMAQASAMGLPRALGQAASVLGVDQQKDKTGQALMLRMAKPRKIKDDGTYVWWDTPDKLEQLIAYCRQDVRTEVAVANSLSEMTPSERQVFLLDQRINDRGIALDIDLVERVKTLAENSSAKIDEEIRRITSGAVKAATNGTDLVAWLRQYGINTTSVDKATVARMLTIENLHPAIRKVLELRQVGAKSSTAKLDSMMEAVSSDGRMHGLLVYHGAATGRWSGRLVQPQNFPRPSIKNDKIETVIAKLKAGESVAEFGAGTTIAADLLRSMLIAKEGSRLMFADYSAIEARVLAWVAGQKDLVSTFANNGDVYKDMASAIYNVKREDVDDDQRQVGKMAILGCGYGMGGKRFVDQCGVMGIRVDEEEAQRIVRIYREKNDMISGYWKRIDAEFLDLARMAIEEKAEFVRLPLPSGRCLHYHNPRIVQRDTPWGTTQDTVQVDTLNSMTRQWTPQLIWGGLLTENIVQATARDLMAGAMMRLETGGYPVICTVHDEIICEVPENCGSLDEMVDLMTTVPSWAEGCPISAEGKEGRRYRK